MNPENPAAAEGMAPSRPTPEDGELLRALLETLPEAIYFKDLDGRFIRLSATLAKWYGLDDPADAVGKSDFDFFTPEFARATRETEEAILRTGTPIIDVEERFVGSDGKSRWVSTTKLPLKDSAGKIIGTVGVSRDVNARKKMEEGVRDAAALYQSLVESIPQCVFRKDMEGRYVYVNRQLCKMMGKRPEDFLGKTDFDVNVPALAEKYRADDQNVMKSQKTFEETEDLKPKGRKKSVRIHITKTPVYDSKGRVVGVQGIFWPEPKASG